MSHAMRPDRADGATRWHRAMQIISDWREAIEGEPLDPEHPHRDFWLAVAVAVFPAYAILEVVLG